MNVLRDGHSETRRHLGACTECAPKLIRSRVDVCRGLLQTVRMPCDCGRSTIVDIGGERWVLSLIDRLRGAGASTVRRSGQCEALVWSHAHVQVNALKTHVRCIISSKSHIQSTSVNRRVKYIKLSYYYIAIFIHLRIKSIPSTYGFELKY
jgi:hypothetical protein